jgi:medium-chain acyl-[acyl-carrier-protein] hydrolase
MTQTTLTQNQLWISCPRPVAKPRLRLICIPYAGSGPVVYHPWVALMPPDVEMWGIRLPGRETRWREPAFTSLAPLVEALAEVLRPSLDTPFVLFGHSMGALISYELVHYWRGQNGPQPVHLMVSGHRAPHRPAINPKVHQADDTTFLNRLKNLGGTPARFFEMEDLVRLTLPALRADFSVWENYQHEARPPLEIPLTTFGGRWDSEAREDDFHAWAQHTAGRFAIHLFNGDHFYFRTDLAPLMAHVQEVLNYSPGNA